MKNIQPSSIQLDDAVTSRPNKKQIDLKLWWFALQKPVKMHEKEKWDRFDVIAQWLISTRATVTQLTLMAGVIAGLLALRDGFFHFVAFGSPSSIPTGPTTLRACCGVNPLVPRGPVSPSSAAVR